MTVMTSAAERATTARQMAGLALVALQRPIPELGTAWDRAAVFLARQAIENAVAAAWLAAGVDETSLQELDHTTRLRGLPALIGDRSLAEDAGLAWRQASRACHHAANRVPCPPDEIRRWAALAAALADSAAGTATNGQDERSCRKRMVSPSQ